MGDTIKTVATVMTAIKAIPADEDVHVADSPFSDLDKDGWAIWLFKSFGSGDLYNNDGGEKTIAVATIARTFGDIPDANNTIVDNARKLLEAAGYTVSDALTDAT